MIHSDFGQVKVTKHYIDWNPFLLESKSKEHEVIFMFWTYVHSCDANSLKQSKITSNLHNSFLVYKSFWELYIVCQLIGLSPGLGKPFLNKNNDLRCEEKNGCEVCIYWSCLMRSSHTLNIFRSTYLHWILFELLSVHLFYSDNPVLFSEPFFTLMEASLGCFCLFIHSHDHL